MTRIVNIYLTKTIIKLLFLENLHQHLRINNVEFIQFAFRWMNNLLMREIPLNCTIRLWDTYHVILNFVHFFPYGD